jgi:CspA family cold shock protein
MLEISVIYLVKWILFLRWWYNNFKVYPNSSEGRCPMPKGTIRRLMDRGYGFIKTEQEEDLFFHRNDIEGVEFSSLSEGQEVEFEKGQGRDGRPQAVKVRLAQPKSE